MLAPFSHENALTATVFANIADYRVLDIPEVGEKLGLDMPEARRLGHTK